MQRKEPAIILVRLGDQLRPLPSRELSAKSIDSAPPTSVGSRPTRQRRYATRAVVVDLPCVPATAMPNRAAISSPSVGMGDHPQAAPPRLDQLGVVGWDRGRSDDQVGAVEVLDGVAAVHSNSPPTETIERGAAGVRSADRLAHPEEQGGEAAHAGARDAHQVWSPAVRHGLHARGPPDRHPRSVRHAPRASGPPECAARACCCRARTMMSGGRPGPGSSIRSARANLDTLSSTPTDPRVISSEDPPKLMNGSVTPYGSEFVTAPRSRSPARGSCQEPRAGPNASGRRAAIRIPRQPMTVNSRMIAIVPTSPSSSPMIARIESVCAFGR